MVWLGNQGWSTFSGSDTGRIGIMVAMSPILASFRPLHFFFSLSFSFSVAIVVCLLYAFYMPVTSRTENYAGKSGRVPNPDQDDSLFPNFASSRPGSVFCLSCLQGSKSVWCLFAVPLNQCLYPIHTRSHPLVSISHPDMHEPHQFYPTC